jgi:hypothetical protein
MAGWPEMPCFNRFGEEAKEFEFLVREGPSVLTVGGKEDGPISCCVSRFAMYWVVAFYSGGAGTLLGV